jgi:acyl-CoA synthetase (AMP-forming)/AMP-acid ligase II
VLPRGGVQVDSDELAKFCGEAFANFKVPTQWEIRSEPLPRNAAGKVLKNVLSGEAKIDVIDE